MRSAVSYRTLQSIWDGEPCANLYWMDDGVTGVGEWNFTQIGTGLAWLVPRSWAREDMLVEAGLDGEGDGVIYRGFRGDEEKDAALVCCVLSLWGAP